MESLPSSDMVEFHENHLNNVRKKYNLDKPGAMDKSIDILEAWLKKQQHLKKTDFSRRYLEITIIVCKGSIERSKEKLDKLCTIKTLLPQYFIGYNVKDVIAKNELIMKLGASKHVTENECRLMTLKISGDKFDSDFCLNIARLYVCIGEFIRNNDYSDGGYIFVDIRDCDLKEALFNVNVLDVHQSATIMLQAYALRIKGIHILSKPLNKFLEILVALLKKALDQKVGGRLMIHTSMETIYEHIPKKLLPKDYSGDDESLDSLYSKCVAEFTSDSFLEYFEEMRVASTDESLRQNPSNNQCIGLPGTFRMLSVD